MLFELTLFDLNLFQKQIKCWQFKEKMALLLYKYTDQNLFTFKPIEFLTLIGQNV